MDYKTSSTDFYTKKQNKYTYNITNSCSYCLIIKVSKFQSFFSQSRKVYVITACRSNSGSERQIARFFIFSNIPSTPRDATALVTKLPTRSIVAGEPLALMETPANWILYLADVIQPDIFLR